MKKIIILVLVFLFLFLLIVMPLIVVFLLSMVPRWHTAFPTSFSLEWWSKILNPKFLKVLSNTAIITVVSTVITIGYGIIAGYVFTFIKFKGKEVLSILILAPTYIAGVVLALGLLVMYSFLRNTFWILLLGHFLIISPIVFKYISSFMSKIPEELVEASYSLGSSKAYTFWKIILPLSKKGILSALVLSIGMNISELSVSLLLYGPQWATIPIQIYLEREYGILGIAGVLSTILIVITIVAVSLLEFVGGDNNGSKNIKP